MKALYALLFLLSTAGVTSLLHAYSYKFQNMTDFNVLIGIRFSSDIGDPIYQKLIQKGTTETFSSGTDFPGGKIGFCLKNVFYIKNPSPEQINDPKSVSSWRLLNDKIYITARIKPTMQDQISKFIKFLGAKFDSFKVPGPTSLAAAVTWPSGCGSVDVYIIQDKAGNIYFLSVSTNAKANDFELARPGESFELRGWSLRQINDALGK
jgi:hypothetical protein